MKDYEKTYKIKLVIAGFIALALSTGILVNSMGQFILPIHYDMGYSVGSISLAFSIICAGVIFAATFVAKFIDKYNPRITMAISTGILAICALLVSFTNEIWQFYLCTIVMGLAFTGLHTLPVSVMINEAFSERRKGFAISLAFSGSGVGGMIFNPFLNTVISGYGWRMGFIIIAIIYLVCGLIIVWLVKTPKNKVGENNNRLDSSSNLHQKIQSDSHINEAEYLEVEVSESYPIDPSENIESSDISYSTAIKSATFWRMSLGMLIINGTGATTMMHSVPYMINTGVSSSKASFLFSLCLLCLAIYKIVLGIICDKFGIAKGTILSIMCFIIGIVVMILLQFSIWIYIGFLLIGCMGVAAPTVTAPLMTSYLFGNKDYTRIFGATIIFTGIGNSFLPSLMGFVYDLTGSYIPGWSVLVVLLIVAMSLYLINFRSYKHKNI